MTIVELPEKAGYAYVVNEGVFVGQLWVEPNRCEITQDKSHWVIRIGFDVFIFADAIRRK